MKYFIYYFSASFLFVGSNGRIFLSSFALFISGYFFWNDRDIFGGYPLTSFVEPN